MRPWAYISREEYEARHVHSPLRGRHTTADEHMLEKQGRSWPTRWSTPATVRYGSSTSFAPRASRSPRGACAACGAPWVEDPKHDRLLRLEKATTSERKIELTEEQIRLLERLSPAFRERHIEAPHTGPPVALDTFFVGTPKVVGKVYLQTAIDCHSRYGSPWVP